MEFCNKTIKWSNETIEETEATMQTIMEREELENVNKTLEINKEATQRVLRQRNLENSMNWSTKLG